MLSGRKFDYDPLLAPGAHHYCFPFLKEICVDNFDIISQYHRANLYDNLLSLIKNIEEKKIRGDMIIDGSFLTKKPKPSDIDVALVIDLDFYESLSSTAHDFVASLSESVVFPGIDSFSVIRYPREHKLFGTGADLHTSIRGDYGIENSNYWTKGYIVISLGENEIGHRIRY